MDPHNYDNMRLRIERMVPEFRGWYQGFADAGFWCAGYIDYTTTLIIPQDIYIGEATGTIHQDFDPGALWDLIIWGDDGGTSLFRITPYEDRNLHAIKIDFATTEFANPDHIPTWTTPSREDFVQTYNVQREIIKTRYADIPGSSK